MAAADDGQQLLCSQGEYFKGRDVNTGPRRRPVLSPAIMRPFTFARRFGKELQTRSRVWNAVNVVLNVERRKVCGVGERLSGSPDKDFAAWCSLRRFYNRPESSGRILSRVS